MGCPTSPGMTVLTTAWMEREWMASIDPQSKPFFKGMRYMDDILLFISLSDKWNHERFLSHFCNECYWKPLTLTHPDVQDTFLETKFVVENQQVQTRLKNDNEWRKSVWRYHHYDSHLSYEMKRATLLSTLRKVNLHASNSKQLQLSAIYGQSQ